MNVSLFAQRSHIHTLWVIELHIQNIFMMYTGILTGTELLMNPCINQIPSSLKHQVLNPLRIRKRKLSHG